MNEGPPPPSQRVAPSLRSLPTTNGPETQGDGLRWADAVGAALVDMEHVQVHPTGFWEPGTTASSSVILAPEALRGVGGVLLRPSDGARFTNELGPRDEVTSDILQLERRADDEAPTAWLVLRREAASAFGPAFGFYHKVKGFFQEAHGTRELAGVLGVEEGPMRASLEAYADCANREGADPFGKTVFPDPILSDAADETVFFAARVTPARHYSMGGVQVDREARVLSADTGRPIPGLFAAGEVTGGIHGGNRLAGNSLLECAVFGSIAGRSAALHVERHEREDL